MTVELVNQIVLFSFVSCLFVGTLTTVIRAAGLRLRNRAMPRLLKRDVLVLVGLSVSFQLIAMSRVFGWSQYVVGQLWWSIVTGVPAVFAVVVYVYYELFVIGQPEDWRVVLRSVTRRALNRKENP